MKHRILTISREFGSGGRTIGKTVAGQLGIPCYDRELIEKIALQSGFDPSYVQAAEESAPTGLLGAFSSNRGFGPTNEDRLWQAQRQVILDLAAQGPCVIVGRGADYILRDKADCLTAFIHADRAFRARRIVEVYGERDQAPEARIREKDKRRAAWHRFYTDEKWGNVKNYQICLDSGILGIDRCAELLRMLY